MTAGFISHFRTGRYNLLIEEKMLANDPIIPPHSTSMPPLDSQDQNLELGQVVRTEGSITEFLKSHPGAQVVAVWISKPAQPQTPEPPAPDLD